MNCVTEQHTDREVLCICVPAYRLQEGTEIPIGKWTATR
jgi:hypothetical protein